MSLPGSYLKMSQFYGAATEEAACGVKEFYLWNKTKGSPTATPAIFYNAGETVLPGSDHCDLAATYPGKTVFLHPQFLLGAEAAVRWRSPVTGTVTVTGSVQCTDPFLSGISWQLDKGATALVGPTETFEDNLMPFGPMAVSVVKGQFLQLGVGLAKGANGSSDSTAVDLTITFP